MKILKPLLLFCSLCALACSARADVTIRLSVKAVLNPATGLRQPGVMDANFANCVAEMNAMLASFGRGYRLQWVGNALINVGGLNQFNSGPSRYYDVDFVNDDDGDALKDQFELNAIANPGTYGWDSTAVNIYITRFGGANWNVCSFPGEHIIIVNGVRGYTNSSTVLHEIGHYFNLSHTFSGRQNLNSNLTSCTNGAVARYSSPGATTAAPTPFQITIAGIHKTTLPWATMEPATPASTPVRPPTWTTCGGTSCRITDASTS